MKKKSFEDCLLTFLDDLVVNMGTRDAIVKIALTPQLFERVAHELVQKQGRRIHMPNLGEIIIFNVQLVERQRDTF